MKQWYAGRPKRTLERYKLFRFEHGPVDVVDNAGNTVGVLGDNSGEWEWLTLFEGAPDGKQQQIDLLNWAMSLCCTGMTPAMIRRELHNKIIDLQGSGEKA